MGPLDALTLENWQCTRSGLTLRKGWMEHVTGLVDPVKSLMPWVGTIAAQDALFAATDDGIWNVTISTATPGAAAFALSGANDAGLIQSINFQAAGTNLLVCCSEADGLILYDVVTGWRKPAEGADPGEIEDVDPADLVQPLSWKERLFFVERDSSSVWYLPAQSFAGTASELDFGPFLAKGGHVHAIASWTLDAGEGVDDHLVIFGSEGDVLVYKGTDPDSDATFAIVGSWQVGAFPYGRRAITQNGGDVLMMSDFGLAPLKALVSGGKSAIEADPDSYVSRVQELLLQDQEARGVSDIGWEIKLHEAGALLIINTPVLGSTQYKQYILSTHSLRWSTFTNIPALTFQEYNKSLYFGTPDGRVCKALTGKYDATPLASPGTGAHIRAVLQGAFDYFKSPGQLKVFHMVRPTFRGPQRPAVRLRMNPEFRLNLPETPSTFVASEGSQWGSAVWGQSQWGGSKRTYQSWKSVSGMGYAGSLSMVTVGVGGTQLVALDYLYDVGGPM